MILTELSASGPRISVGNLHRRLELRSSRRRTPLIRLQMEDVFPLSIEGLWELLHAHLDEVRLPEIHPRVLWGRLVREEGTVEYLGLTFPREKVVERAYRIGGRSLTTTWDYRIEPPDRYAYDVTFPNGSTIRFDNRYTPAAGGTLVKTTAEISLKRMPLFAHVGSSGVRSTGRIERTSPTRDDRRGPEGGASTRRARSTSRGRRSAGPWPRRPSRTRR